MSSFFQSRSNQGIFLPLEGLRGILALIVCFGHFGLGIPLARLFPAFNLHYAVDLFFVLSGFVMAYANYYAFPAVGWYEFIVKRLSRLYPVHFVTFMVVLLVYSAQNRIMTTGDIFKNLFLIHNIGFEALQAPYNFPSWSISVELWCTLFFLGLTAGVKKMNMPPYFLVSLLAFPVFLVSFLSPALLMQGAYEQNFADFINIGLVRGFTGTGLGILLYLAIDQRRTRRMFIHPLVGYGSLISLGSFFVFNLPLWCAPVFYVSAFILIGHWVVKPEFLPLFRSRFLVVLGAWSYALYLWHIPVYLGLQHCFGNGAVKGILGKLILLPTLFLLAWASHRFFERPLQRKIKQWGFSDRLTSHKISHKAYLGDGGSSIL